MPQCGRTGWVAMVWVVVCCALATPARAQYWTPIAHGELLMTAEPQAPGAPAIYLDRRVDRDDVNSTERHYARIKILTEAGRKYADVEIFFNKGEQRVDDIEARATAPSGIVSKFDGTVYDKPIVEGQGVNVAARTFTLPGVEVGSVIEYRYILRLREGYIYNSHWILSEELFTSHASFSMVPDRNFSLRMSWPRGLPPGTANPVRQASGNIRLETQNVPAFVHEDYAPPDNELKYRVDFIYQPPSNRESEPDPYWRVVGGASFRQIDDFMDKSRAMTQAVAQIVQPQDSPAIKLQKIYARVQQLTNTSYAPPLAEEESKRLNATPARNVEDVWRQARGDSDQLNWLFIGLARAAGIAADPAMVSRRDQYFFDQRYMNQWLLDDSLVIVTLDGKDLFVDPGVPFTPFGQLNWDKTGVAALRLQKRADNWLTTPVPAASDSLVERHVNFQLSASDLLEGTISVRYTGQEALWRRLQERNEDATARKSFLEQDLAGAVPVGVTAKLTNEPDWQSSEAPLVAEFSVSIPGWFTMAGHRALFPVGLFGNGEKPVFTGSGRTQPLYFSFPYRHVDDVAVKLPAGWSATSLPGARNADLKGVAFTTIAAGEDQAINLRRELTVNATLIAATNYETLHKFFELVRSSDEEQAVLSPTPSRTRP